MRSIEKVVVESQEDIVRARQMILDADGIIDAMLGTGFTGKTVREPASSVIDYINAAKAYVVSNDVPSGTDADPGSVPDKTVVPDVTVVLHMKKKGKIPGLVVVESIGIPPDAQAKVL